MIKAQHFVVGKILKAQGVKGMVKVVSYMQDPAQIFAVDLFFQVQNVSPIDVRLHQKLDKQNFICSVEGFLDRSAAEKLHSIFLLAKKSILPTLEADEFYINDLKESVVVDCNGKEIGIVKDIYNFGAGDIIEINFLDGTKQMYSFDSKTFPTVDVNAKIVVLDPPITI